MATGYKGIIAENLSKIFDHPSPELLIFSGAEQKGESLVFNAFGQACSVDREKVTLSQTESSGPRALIITLYLLHANADEIQMEPFRSFKDFPGSMPYHGAFSANSERVLIPHVPRIQERRGEIRRTFRGDDGRDGDFSLILYPLPRIALYYIFYTADEEFPASTTCLFSSNALSFMPLDGLADLAEYTSKEIIRLVKK